MPEQELAVEVGHVDGVHVNYVDLAKAAQCQVLKQLAAQAACPHAQHAYLQSGEAVREPRVKDCSGQL